MRENERDNQECTSITQSKQIGKSLNAHRDALNDLIQSCKAAVLDMQRAITGRAHALVYNLFVNIVLWAMPVCSLGWRE